MAAKRQAKIEDLFGKSKKIQKRDESEASSDTQTCEPVVAASTQPSERTHDPRDDGETVGETVTAAAVVSSAMSDDDSVVKIDASDAEKKKGKKRRFQKEWLQKYSWLRFSPEKMFWKEMFVTGRSLIMAELWQSLEACRRGVYLESDCAN